MPVKPDPVTLEVIRNALPAISNEMAADLQRTSYNMMIYEVRDFCTALISAEGELISQNVGGVSHFVADLGVIITDGMKRYGKDGFADGDVLIMNHPAVAGQHLNNICIYMPYFFKGELLMFSMVRAHWIDVGGMSTGFGAGRAAQDAWMEGMQFDQLKIYEGGKLNEMLHRCIKDNIRFPESSMGDLRSQIAACRLGNRRADELFERYGRDTVMAAIRRVFDETEQRCRNAVKHFADGVYEAESFIDDTGETPPQPVRIHATVTVKRGAMTIDLSECSKERPHGPNCRSLAGARIAYKAITAPTDPVNEGSFRALDIVLPEGNFMMARHPIPMQGWSLMLPTVADTIVAALAPAMKDKAPAGHHADLGGSAFFGVDPKTKRRFVLQSIDGGGWGGRPHEDGESGSVSICQGDVRNGAIEAIELKCPVMIEKRGLRQDSGGAGKYRGGLGIELQVRNFVEGRWNLGKPYRQGLASWPLWGGEPGATADSQIRRPGENEFHELYGHRYLVPAETQVLARRAGGGGWGDPLEREAELVRWDVVEGYVSREAAQDQYGVVLKDDLALDAKATETLRQKLRGERAGNGRRKVAMPVPVTDGAGVTALRTDLTVFATRPAAAAE
jgi:N-methylhydantoinase B